jgi:hypothetical protein
MKLNGDCPCGHDDFSSRVGGIFDAIVVDVDDTGCNEGNGGSLPCQNRHLATSDVCELYDISRDAYLRCSV